METSVENEQKFFILFWNKYYFIHKLKFSYFNNLFRNVIQTSGVIVVITLQYANLRCRNNATVCESPMLNFQLFKVSTPGESIFQSGISLKTRFSKFPRYFHVLAFQFIQINVITLPSDGVYVCSLKLTQIESPYMVSKWSFAFTRKSPKDVLRRL